MIFDGLILQIPRNPENAGEEILIFGGEAYDGRELTFYSAGQPMGNHAHRRRHLAFW